MRHPVVIITVKDGMADTYHADGPEPLIIDYDTIGYADDLDTPADYIETLLTLPIDTIDRIHLVDSIFSAMGHDSEACVTAFGNAVENLNLPPIEDLSNLGKWAGWLSIETQRDPDGNYVHLSKLPEPSPESK